MGTTMSTSQPGDNVSASRQDIDAGNQEDKMASGDVQIGINSTHSNNKALTRKSRSKLKNEPSEPFRLMALPAELRLMVYKELLVKPDGVVINLRSRTPENIAKHKPVCSLHDKRNHRCSSCSPIRPNILATSKTVREEAQDTLWAQKFVFTNPETLHAFLLLLTSASISRLRNIEIVGGLVNYGGRNLLFFSPLRDAINLQVLQFQHATTIGKSVYMADAKAADRLATIFFKTMYPFVRAIAARRGVDGVLDIVKFHLDDMHCPGSQEGKPWDSDREQAFFRFMRAHLVDLVGHENARIAVSA